MSKEQVAERIQSAELNSAGFYRINCPFCVERVFKIDRSRSMYVHEFGRFSCFRCHVVGHLHLGGLGVKRIRFKPPQLPSGCVDVTSATAKKSMVLRGAIEYLKGRNVSADTAYEIGITATVEPPFAYRLVLPVLDGAQPGWIGRSWVGSPRRYITPGVNAASALWNGNRLTKRGTIIVTEGPFDAISIWPDGVAVFGKPSSDQIERLAVYGRERGTVAVALDWDARREGWALTQQLKLRGAKSVWIDLDPETDPGDYSAAELWKLVDIATQEHAQLVA